jgi:hypothetical protein
MLGSLCDIGLKCELDGLLVCLVCVSWFSCELHHILKTRHITDYKQQPTDQLPQNNGS